MLDLLSQLVRMATVVPLAVAAELAPLGGSAEAGVADGWRELRNTSRAVDRFWAAPRLTPSEPGADSWRALERELVHRLVAADADEPWEALWLREGLGFRWSEAAWDAGRRPRAVLFGPTKSRWSRWRLPLHTGMGLSLALRALAPLALPIGLPIGRPTGQSAAGRTLEETVERFDAWCREGSGERCAAAAFEALGLVTRVLHPGRVGAVDRLLRESHPDAPDRSDRPDRPDRPDRSMRRESFWHGLGRGLYLTPAGSLPRMRPTAYALERARREAPDRAARRNALAGLAWALTLVNFLHPGVVAAALREPLEAADRADRVDRADRAQAEGDGDALVDGVARATVVWADALGASGAPAADRTLEAFLAWRADGTEDAVRSTEIWRDRVVPRCRQALAAWLTDGHLPERFGGLFRASPGAGVGPGWDALA